MKNKKTKIIICIVGVCFVGVLLIQSYLNGIIISQSENAEGIQALEENINNYNLLIQNSEAKLEQLQAEHENIIDESMITSIASKNNLKITKFMTNIDKQMPTISLEVNGTLPQIVEFVTCISKNSATVLHDISLRQKGDLFWLARSFDNVKVLPWLVFQETDIENQPKAENEIPVDTTVEQHIEETLFNQADMLCYMQIELIR